MKKKIIILLLFIGAFFCFADTKGELLSTGIEAFQNEEFEKSRKIFERLIDISPRSGESYFYLGQIYTIQEDLNLASLNLKKAIEIDPKWSAAYSKLGQVFSKLGDVKNASINFRQAIRFDNENEEALKYFGDLYFQKREFDKAKQFYNKLRTVQGNNPHISKNLGFIYLFEQDLDKALNYFSMYSGLFPFDKDISNRVFLIRFINNNNNPEILRKRAKETVMLSDLSQRDVKEEFRTEKKEIKNIEQDMKRNNQIKKVDNTGKYLFKGMIAGISLLIIIPLVIIIKKHVEDPEIKEKRERKRNKIDLDLIKNTDNIEQLLSLYIKAKNDGDKSACLEIEKKVKNKGDYSSLLRFSGMFEDAGENEKALEMLENINEDLGPEKQQDLILSTLLIMVKVNMFEKASKKFDELKNMTGLNMNLIIKKLNNLPRNIFKDLNIVSRICDFLVSNNSSGKAKSIYEKFIESSENEDDITEAQLKLLKLLEKEKLYRECVIIYKDLIEKNPKNVNLYFGIVKTYLQAGDMKHALIYINTIFKGFPDKIDDLLNICIDQLQKNPDNKELYKTVIDICENNDALKKYAYQTYKKFIEHFDEEETNRQFYNFLLKFKEEEALDSIDIFIDKGWSKYFPDFLKDLNDFLKRNPEDRKRIDQMASILKKSGRDSEAFILYKKIFDIDDKDNEVIFNMFRICLKLQRMDDMRNYAKILLQRSHFIDEMADLLGSINSLAKEDMLLLVKILIRSGNKEQAIEKLRFLEIKYSDDIEIKEISAELLKSVNKKEALEKYKSLLVKDPENIGYWIEVANIFEANGSILQAEKSWNKILKGSEEHFEEAVSFYVRNGLFDKAQRLYKEKELSDRRLYSYMKNEKSKFEFKILKQILNGVSVENKINHLIDGKTVEVEKTDFLKEVDEEKDKFIIQGYMAERLYYMGAYDEAIELCQSLLKKNEVWNLRYCLGMSFLETGLTELAFKEFSRIDWNSTQKPHEDVLETIYKIALDFEERHMEKESLYFYKEAFAIDMNYKDVRKKIESLDSKILMSRTIDESTGLSLEIRKRYEIIQEIGKGGMGIVYKAKDKKLGRMVALKVMLSEFVNNKEAVSRFLKEARSIATLSHPNIVGIFDISSENNVYISMEYIEGNNLKEILQQEKRLPLSRAVFYAEKICDALNFAHNHKIIHRDIKPENIMVDMHNNIKIMDFGLAKIENEVDGEIMGTPFFMSPEQIKGERIDGRSDIYSLGVTLYQLLAGKLPFDDGDIKQRHLIEDPISPSAYNPEITIQMDKIILKCMQKHPDDRYSSMMDLKKDIKNIY